ncbi:hypothetical protein QE152_g13349 [Popillia japonica]|uniref:Uncharacterized protein n=1 Tax=Popillia japonica TaxID=7064 RepID=A0AAW1LCH0_POPJA
MRPFKAAYNEACAKWMNQYRPLKITQRDIAGLVKTAFQAICRIELGKSGFACTGLYPLQKDIYLAAAHFSEENGAHNDTVPKTATPLSGPPLDETDKFDAAPPLATPSTSKPCVGPQSTKPSLFLIVTDKISTVTNEVRKKMIQRMRRNEKSEILTGTQYKSMLEKKFKDSQKKMRKTAEKKEKKMQLSRKIQSKQNKEKYMRRVFM